ncbi:MAG: von Willebrand factor type A domain-containing protein [Planctomycetaceae bacterium]
MSDNSFDPNDPRLTDYVLGELGETERAEVERLLDRSPEARAAVDEILEVSGLLTESLKAAPAPSLTKDQRAAIDAEALNVPKVAIAATARRRPLVRAAATLATVAVSVAALWLVVIRLQDSTATGVTRKVARLNEVSDRSSSMDMEQAQTQGLDGRPEPQTEFAVGAQSNSHFMREEMFGKPVTHDRGGEAATATAPAQYEPVFVPLFDPGQGGPTAGPSVATPALESAPQSAAEASTVVISDGRARNRGVQGQSSPAGGKVERDDGQLGRVEAVVGDAKNGSSNTVSLGESSAPSAPLAQGVVTMRLDPRQLVAAAEKAAEQQRAYQYGLFDNSKSMSKDDGKNAEAYDAIVENPFYSPSGAPLSTFSIDVDTASYSNMRRFLASGQQPPRDSVRIEELVNYFDYEDPAPTDGRPFAVRLEAASCPWAADHRLVRVSLKGKEIAKSERPPTNLVFLLDVSGSMRDDNKLPLVRQAMKLLVGEMTEDDRIAIVTYAGNAGLVLDSTTGDKKDVIVKAIDNLQAGGSTNGEAGIHLAYSTAVAHLFQEGSNRVILCTDGDFNVGVSGDDELVNIIQEKARDSHVFLSIFGFGMGNLKDAKLEKLADKGNGHYAYVDNLREAKKVFVEGLTGTLYTIAKDVKLQVEFNPAKVGAYRLIGYENRVMPAEHFNDDTKDAGEIGAGHCVTALYELIPADKMATVAKRPGLKYQELPQPKEEPKATIKASDELLTVWLRYKQPDGNKSEKLEFPLVDKPGDASQGSRDMQWTTAVAAFGMLLRGSQFRGQASFDMVLELAQAGRGEDKSGRRAEFIELAKTAKTLYSPQPSVPPSAQTSDPKSPQ